MCGIQREAELFFNFLDFLNINYDLPLLFQGNVHNLDNNEKKRNTRNLIYDLKY